MNSINICTALKSNQASAATSANVDFTAIKQRQQAIWASGDYATIGITLQIVGEMLAEAADIRAGESVLDVAAGNGNASLAAARRFAHVTSTDYVPHLLEKGAVRAQAEGFNIQFQIEDVEDLPFKDESFDVVLSTFGAMFAPNQPRVAQELIRQVRKDGRIGMANWTPEGFLGELLRTIASHVPPPPGVQSPLLWGKENGSSSCSVAMPQTSVAFGVTSTSAIALQSTGSRYSQNTTVPYTRRVRHWNPSVA